MRSCNKVTCMADTQTEQGSPLWRFSLRFYRRPGVADACIALQDGCGVDINILLFFLWLAAARRCVPSAAAAAGCARVGPWRDEVVGPFRALRRRLKDGSSPGQTGAAELILPSDKALQTSTR